MSRLSSVDFPAFVYPTSATVESARRCRALRWVSRVRPSPTRSRSSLVIRRWMRRRSTSSWVSPGPRVPMPPPCLRERRPAAAQAGQAVAELRELDLHHALLARGVLGEDVEDQRDAVDDVAFEQLLQVALLGRGELVVEDHDVDVERLGELAQLLGLALADVGAGSGVSRRCSSMATGSAPAVSASSASSSRLASASSAVAQAEPVPTRSAR